MAKCKPLSRKSREKNTTYINRVLNAMHQGKSVSVPKGKKVKG